MKCPCGNSMILVGPRWYCEACEKVVSEVEVPAAPPVDIEKIRRERLQRMRMESFPAFDSLEEAQMAMRAREPGWRESEYPWMSGGSGASPGPSA